MALKHFIEGFKVAAVWSLLDDNEEPLDRNYSPDDFSDEAMKLIEEDCSRFYAQHAELWQSPDGSNAMLDARAGSDFWLTRNGHGAGFWDGAYANDEALAEAAEDFGELHVEAHDGELFFL